jgi:AcrR family transcriptional regulator
MTDQVPPELRRLWGIADDGVRLGRPAELDVERVVRTAVALADRDGLAEVTLPKVAKALGYSPMSLYRYVGSKDELLVLMTDRGLEQPPAISTAGWRAGLREYARAERRLYERRPWLVRIPTSGPPSGPNSISWMEAYLSVLRDTALDWPAKVGVLMLVSGYVRSSTLLSHDLAHGRSGTEQGEVEEQYGRSLARLVDPQRFPEAAKLFASSTFDDAGPGSGDPADGPDFIFGLERILDGVAAIVESGS